MKARSFWLLVFASCAVPVPEEGMTPGGQSKPGVRSEAWSPGEGFVVHEWGTLTSVVGSDGSLLPGLHHEEEDLPGFVADRLAAAQTQPSVVQKMETPVTYFYAPSKLTVSAKVAFPKGVLTQWFPYVAKLEPAVFFDDTNPSRSVDPWLQTNVTPPHCVTRFSGPLEKGLLDWGNFTVLPPQESPPLAGPLGDTTWGFARQVKANALEVPSPTGGPALREKFLFYRGLGNFELPLTGRAAQQSVTFENRDGQHAMGRLVLMNVTAQGAGFVRVGDVAANGTKSAAIPAATLPLGDFVAQLKTELKTALTEDGLYADEAQAMVDTWERSYFLTPGVRALYLLPQARTDAVIPLTVSPAPKVMKRTMVIRLELLTAEEEATESQWLKELAAAPTQAGARAKFLKLGRFTEPHLSRAVAQASDAAQKSAGEALLLEVRGTRRWAPTAAE